MKQQGVSDVPPHPPQSRGERETRGSLNYRQSTRHDELHDPRKGQCPFNRHNSTGQTGPDGPSGRRVALHIYPNSGPLFDQDAVRKFVRDQWFQPARRSSFRPRPARAPPETLDAREPRRVGQPECSPAGRPRPAGNRRVARRDGGRAPVRRAGARPVPARIARRQGGQGGPRARSSAAITTPYVNTIPAEDQPAFPGNRETRTPDQEHRPLERDGDGAEGEQEHQRRRAHLDLRQRRDALRNRLQPLLPRPHRDAPRRRHLLPGPRQPRHVRAGVRGGPARRDPAQELPAGTARQAAACRATRTRG